MAPPQILLTGFGPFPGVEHNPSGELALALAADPPPGLAVSARVLPVSFQGVGAAYDDFLEEAATPAARLLLALGVHPGATFRLERRARHRLESDRADGDGHAPGRLDLGGDRDLETPLDLEHLAQRLQAAGAPAVELSHDAGQYVCERTYHHVLRRAEERGIPGLFLHVPPAASAPVPVQLGILRAWLPSLLPSLPAP